MMDQKDMDIEKETVAYVVKRDTIAGNVRIRIKIMTWIRRRRTRTMWQIRLARVVVGRMKLSMLHIGKRRVMNTIAMITLMTMHKLMTLNSRSQQWKHPLQQNQR